MRRSHFGGRPDDGSFASPPTRQKKRKLAGLSAAVRASFTVVRREIAIRMPESGGSRPRNGRARGKAFREGATRVHSDWNAARAGSTSRGRIDPVGSGAEHLAGPFDVPGDLGPQGIDGLEAGLPAQPGLEAEVDLEPVQIS